MRNNDGVCNDGGPGSEYEGDGQRMCQLGYDCDDCGQETYPTYQSMSAFPLEVRRGSA